MTRKKKEPERKNCPDQCALLVNRDRWVIKVDKKTRKEYYECSKCGRFIGYRFVETA